MIKLTGYYQGSDVDDNGKLSPLKNNIALTDDATSATVNIELSDEAMKVLVRFLSGGQTPSEEYANSDVDETPSPESEGEGEPAMPGLNLDTSDDELPPAQEEEEVVPEGAMP